MTTNTITFPITDEYAGDNESRINQLIQRDATTSKTTFKNFIDAVLVEGLGISQIDADSIYSSMLLNFDDSAKYQIVHNTTLNQLIAADVDIRNLEQSGTALGNILADPVTRGMWNTFKVSLGKLQGLVILKKITTNDCKPVIDTLITAFNTKINTVNEILQENLQAGGGLTGGSAGGSATVDPYKRKYWKYKLKYELLKKSRE